MKLLNRLCNYNLIASLSQTKFENHKICDTCQMGEQIKTFFKSKNHVSMSSSFELCVCICLAQLELVV